jgi:hypothetical protein
MLLTRRSLPILLLLVSAQIASATIEDLQSLLRSVESAARPPTIVRADGVLAIKSPEKEERRQIVIVQREDDLYLELREGGMKALLIGADSQSLVLATGDQKERKLDLSEPLFGSDFTREDLEPFSTRRYAHPTVIDEGANHVTVALRPAQSQYSLVVATIERAKNVPVKVLYYLETTNNLVKMRRDLDHTLIGRRWFPGRITMEHFQLRTSSELELKWTQSPQPIAPEIFQPAFLKKPSGIIWPEKP